MYECEFFFSCYGFSTTSGPSLRLDAAEVEERREEEEKDC